MVLTGSSHNAVYYNGYKYSSIQRIHRIGRMHGVKRVALFCTMTTLLPTILIITPLYLRHSIFADVEYSLAESDVVAIKDGLSSVFCESHTLKMNTSFNAFQLKKHPILSRKRKHIRLKKSMSLPDDTLEYWGFYLLRGATVALKVCSRYQGSRILVVRGERNLRTCGLLEHNFKKFGATMDEDHNKVKVTFETTAQEIHDSHGDLVEFDPNTAAEDLDGHNAADEMYVKKRLNKGQKYLSRLNRTRVAGNANATVLLQSADKAEAGNQTKSHRKRHAQRKSKRSGREKRQTGVLLDGRIGHGGNALNYTSMESEENSVSSFETNLLTCYDGSILLTQGFPPSHLCENVSYLERGKHMEMVHEVASDGYYYYIFYSDNDYVYNDIHAVFDIFKPTYQYNNVSKSEECLNSTECNFSIPFWTDRTVIVEVPTRDGIEHEEDDITILVSTCQPRMAVYMIFPISVMFLILGCAFL